jgi:hypothetical protein
VFSFKPYTQVLFNNLDFFASALRMSRQNYSFCFSLSHNGRSVLSAAALPERRLHNYIIASLCIWKYLITVCLFVFLLPRRRRSLFFCCRYCFVLFVCVCVCVCVCFKLNNYVLLLAKVYYFKSFIIQIPCYNFEK